MEISGRIKKIFETKEISASFRKRELVITTEEQYPQHIIMEFTQDKVSELDKFKEGDKVQVNINIRGREWTSPQGEVKYFNSIQGWRISSLDAQPANADMPPMDEPAAGGDLGGDDDLPF
ncbi:MAG: DUF3127 domain-containing protein [Schleiferiaceae bacterium]|jgi:translation initiation factor IF-3|nr:DUF3127 domain-containing protein [Schleiferiaceae bacterium]